LTGRNTPVLVDRDFHGLTCSGVRITM
jgi:hypothetical protein